MIKPERKVELEKIAAANDGHCDRCGQTIKFYRYKVSHSHCNFLRAMADRVRDTGINDVDIGDINIAYSVRSQVTKMRQHGLIARVKGNTGAQIARRWLITKKGWDFLTGKPIPDYVIVFNNQVLGHDGEGVTIHQVLGEKFDPNTPVYEESPVTPKEAVVYNDVRKAKSYETNAIYRGRSWPMNEYAFGGEYKLQINKLQIGKPVIITEPYTREYKDIAAFKRDWKVI